MGNRSHKRMLAAILAADVEGFTRLMGLDEEGTIERLAHHRRIVNALIAKRHGRNERTEGDSIIVHFGSAVEAVKCAIEIQQEVALANRNISRKRRMSFRIGVNVGDVVLDRGIVHGDGVHVAVRLQQLADAGNVLISRSAYDFVWNKNIGCVFEDIGKKRLKNISYPVHAYKIVPVPPEKMPSRADGVIVPPLNVPGFGNRPAIAVLPFVDLSGRVEQEYIADGIADEIITSLACWREFPVIARNSSFKYKGQRFDVREVGQELGVRYLLQGTVRKARNQIRVSAQLIDVSSGHHLLAEVFSRELMQLATLQEDIAAGIVGAMEPELQKAERERAINTPPRSITAYDCLQRGMWHHYKYTKAGNTKAQGSFRRALELDPDYSQALAAFVLNKVYAAYSGWTSNVDKALIDAFEMAQRAVSLDARNPAAHFAFGMASMWMSETDIGISAMQSAIALNPSFAAAHANLGFLLNYTGRAAEAIGCVEKAIRLSPYDNRLFIWLPALAGAHYQLRNYEEAIKVGKRAIVLKSDYPAGLRYVVASLGQLERRAEAQEELVALLKIEPRSFDHIEVLRKLFRNVDAIEHLLEGLRKAGMSI